MRRIGGAAVAAVVLVLLTGCGSQATGPTATPTVTVIRTPSASPSSTPTPTVTTTVTASPSVSTAPSDTDTNRPAGQCADTALGVSVISDPGGAAAGSVYYDVLFTNTGGSSCVLRGTPGVSVVGDGNGTQLGQPADRNQDDVRTVRLAVGGSAVALLQVVDIAAGGGPIGAACDVKQGDGYRVYAPHSTRAFFSRVAHTVACTSSRVFMTVQPVKPYTP